jgi:hypothetical protein
MSLNSKAGIANRALEDLGQPPLVTDPDALQEYEHADTVLRAYDDLIDDALTDTNWSFNTTRVTLSPDPTPPAFGYAYRYALPGDCLKVWALDEKTHGKRPDYKVEGGYILFNDGGGLNLIYLRPVYDPTQFSGDFAIALAARIAEACALKILGSGESADWFAKRAMRKTEDAASSESQQNPPRDLDDSGWTYRRRTG